MSNRVWSIIRSTLNEEPARGRRANDASKDGHGGAGGKEGMCRCRCTCVVAIALYRRDRDAYEVISSRWAQTSCRRDASLRATLDERRWSAARTLESRGEDRDKMVRQG